MTEPQIWTLLGAFVVALFGMLTIITTLFTRVIRTEIGGVRAELRSEIGSVRSEIGGVRSEIGSLRSEMDARFDGVHTRMDSLDRDVQALMKHAFGIDRG